METILQHKNQKAIVVGVQKKNPTEQSGEAENSLNELILLLKTLGIETKEKFTYKAPRLNTAFLIGRGKVSEVKRSLDYNQANLVVFDHSLTALQVKNLEEELCCKVIDRSLVIIDIFSSHAKTKTAKLQVEIAWLEYLLPRLKGAWTHFQRQQGGGLSARGMGETQIEVDRRRARQRISHLKKNLKTVITSRSVQRKSRQKELKVTLVGYTNSGKTTIMSSLSCLKTHGKDELFATLDPKTRVLDPSSHPKILISDTVGFIRNLPHSLIESFKSTLEETRFSDLLVHVVDLSSSDYRTQLETTIKVLEEIKADGLPCLTVFNKADQVDNPFITKIIRKEFPDSLIISSFDENDIKRLRDYILAYFKKQFSHVKIVVPSLQEHTLAYIHSNCLIVSSDYSEQNKIKLEIKASKQVISKLQKYITEERPESWS